MKHNFFRILVALLSLTLLFGSVANAGAAPSVVKIMTFQINDEAGKQQWQDVENLFESKYPGVDLQVTGADVTIEGGKLTTMLNSGVDLPDVINTNAGPSRIGLLASSGMIMPLTGLYQKNGWDKLVNPAAQALCTVYDGKVYEVPNSMDAISCYYNKEIFSQLGLQVPTTIEQFLDNCQKIKDAGIEPIAVGARDGYACGWIFGNILQSVAGKDVVQQLVQNEIPWTTDKVVAALDFLGGLVQKGYISDASTSRGESDSLYLFTDGKAAMYFVGTWAKTALKDANMLDKVGTFVLPPQNGAEVSYPTSGLGNSWVIPAALTDTAGAEMWLNFLLSDEYAQYFAKAENNSTIYASAAFSNCEVSGEMMQSAIASIKENAGMNPSVFIGAATKNAYYQSLQGIMANIVTAQEAAQNIQLGQDEDKAK